MTSSLADESRTLEDSHGFALARYFDPAACGRPADLASQPRMGLWPQWAVGNAPADRAGAFAAGLSPPWLLKQPGGSSRPSHGKSRRQIPAAHSNFDEVGACFALPAIAAAGRIPNRRFNVARGRVAGLVTGGTVAGSRVHRTVVIHMAAVSARLGGRGIHGEQTRDQQTGHQQHFLESEHGLTPHILALFV